MGGAGVCMLHAEFAGRGEEVGTQSDQETLVQCLGAATVIVETRGGSPQGKFMGGVGTRRVQG